MKAHNGHLIKKWPIPTDINNTKSIGCRNFIKMKKKILKIIGILLVLFIGVLVSVPFFLEAKIGDIIRNNVNNSIKGNFDFAEADLSLLSSFPNAEVSLREIFLVNEAPFEGDTLFAAREVELKMGLGELFKGEEDPISVKSLIIDGAQLNIQIDEADNANYDIAKEDTSNTEDVSQSEGFRFALESYQINDSRIAYHDMATALRLEMVDIQHSGTGDLSLDTSELETTTDALVSFEMDSVQYLERNKVKLDALLGIDLKENKYTFLRNEALVNQLPLIFDGFVKVNEDNQQVGISFKTPSSDFKNFLAVIPEEYSKNIENVQTTGDFVVAGNFTGIVDEEHIPKFSISIRSDNASFKYPDLPKTVNNIFIDADVQNTTGIAEDTYVDVRKASFMIDQDKFTLVSKITDLMGNTKVSAQVDGKIDLANIPKAYPVASEMELKGILTADISTAFDMASVENKRYENTQTKGQLEVKGFEYKSEELANPVKLDILAMNFNPATVQLTDLKGTTGKTDFNANGTVHNLLGYLFNDEIVKGNFDLRSNTFVLNDFMAEKEPAPGKDEKVSGKGKSDSKSPTNTEQIKIPAFLDATINAAANTVIYDNITLKDVRGNLRIKDQKATLSNMTSSIFEGKMAFNGEVSTKGEVPVFNMKLDMAQLEIGETFKGLDLFKTLAPIAKILRGKLDTDIELSGNLTDDFVPNLLTLSGNVLANVMAKEINEEEAPLLSALDNKLDFINLKELNLQDLKTKLSFENGLVSVNPFTIKYRDIAINVDGSHTFDQKLNYKATLQVPARYLGTEVNNLLAKIDEKELDSLTIPVIASIGGNYNSPQVSTDLTSGVKSLTSKLVEIQKQKLINQGKDKAKDLIGGILSENGKGKDSTGRRDSTKVGIKEVLGGVLSGNQKKKDSATSKSDSVANKEAVVKEKAKDIIGGLFGKKKDTAKVKKDSVN